MRVLRWVLVLMMCAAFAAWACGGGDDDGSGDDGGNGDNVDITDECSNADFGAVDVPDEVEEAGRDDLPDDFPVYDGADFECGFKGESEGISGVVAIFSTGDDVDEVKTFYDDEFLGDGPWRSQGSSSAAGSTFWTLEHDGDQGGFVSVSEDGDNTAITVVISDDPDLGADDDDSSSGDDTGDDDASSGDDDSSTGDDDASGSGDLPDEVDLPDDFPSDDVDLPEGRIINASSFTSGGTQSFVVEILSTDSVDDLAANIRDSFDGKGWTQSFQTESQGVIAAAYTENADATGMVVNLTIGESPYEGYNTVSLAVVSQ